MTRIRGLAVPLVVLLVLGLAACTTTSAGEPRPTDDATATDSSDPDDSTTSEEPPERPREIPLDSVDPCTLLTQSDYSDYHINGPGRPSTNSEGQPICAWVDSEVGGFGIVLNLDEGIDVWLDGSKGDNGERADPIDDFPTVTSLSNLDDNVCFAAVDVAKGQHLLAQVDIYTSKLSTVPPVCEYAYQLAESAMNTLVGS